MAGRPGDSILRFLPRSLIDFLSSFFIFSARSKPRPARGRCSSCRSSFKDRALRLGFLVSLMNTAPFPRAAAVAQRRNDAIRHSSGRSPVQSRVFYNCRVCKRETPGRKHALFLAASGRRGKRGRAQGWLFVAMRFASTPPNNKLVGNNKRVATLK